VEEGEALRALLALATEGVPRCIITVLAAAKGPWSVSFRDVLLISLGATTSQMDVRVIALNGSLNARTTIGFGSGMYVLGSHFSIFPVSAYPFT
jgi:hypothetical protein